MEIAFWIVVGLGIVLLLKKLFEYFCDALRASGILKFIVWVVIVGGCIWAISSFGDMSLWRAAGWFFLVFIGLAFWGWITD